MSNLFLFDLESKYVPPALRGVGSSNNQGLDSTDYNSPDRGSGYRPQFDRERQYATNSRYICIKHNRLAPEFIS